MNPVNRISIPLVSRIKGFSPVTRMIIFAALAKLIIHLLTGSSYGFFQDELYTIALSKHLDFGYMDLPPLFPLLVAGSRFLFGESLIACHILPSLAGALTVVFACLIVRELGGKLFAVVLTALAFITSPWWLILDSVLCYDSIDQLVLTVFLFLIARFLRTGDRRLWIAFGVTAGIAFLTKATILFLGPGFVIAILASKFRRQLLSAEPWIAVGIFLVLASPYVIWNYVNHWPTVAYWVSYGTQRVYRYSFLEYLANIPLTMGFALAPFLVAGLYRIFRRFSDTSFHVFGILFLATFVIVFVLRARAIVLAELCVPLVAAAAVWMEEKLQSSVWMKSLRIAAVSLLLAEGIVAAPLSVPILPESGLLAYAKTFSFMYKGLKDFKSNPGWSHLAYLLGRTGWDEIVKAVADVYNSLPPEDRAQAGILAGWYGPAGAVDLLGKRYGLPGAVCGSMNYHRWGPGKSSWDVMIFVSVDFDTRARTFFWDATLAAMVGSKVPGFENAYYIYICRTPNMAPEVLWPDTLMY
jgi:4-amino-4-deoxy-L-arabinose transferase-like glycosyltransferase